MEVIKHIWMLFFNPEKLKKLCAELYSEGHKQQHPDYYEANKEKIYQDGYSQWSKSVDKLRNGIFKAFRWGFQMIIAVFAAWFIIQQSGIVVNKTMVGVLKISGPLIVLWSVQGKAGYNVQSIDGDSIVDKINAVWSRWLYMVGVFIALLAQVL